MAVAKVRAGHPGVGGGTSGIRCSAQQLPHATVFASAFWACACVGGGVVFCVRACMCALRCGWAVGGKAICLRCMLHGRDACGVDGARRLQASVRVKAHGSGDAPSECFFLAGMRGKYSSKEVGKGCRLHQRETHVRQGPPLTTRKWELTGWGRT